MSRRLWSLLIAGVLLFGALPAQAQFTPPADDSLIGWIPADFVGYIRVRVDDPIRSLAGLRLLTVIASLFQPTRFAAPTQANTTYETFFPLDALSTSTFDEVVLPWLQGDIVIAYRQIDPPFTVDPSNILLILPTRDPFVTAGTVRDLVSVSGLTSRTFGSVSLYEQGNTALALLPDVVLIGGTPAVEAAINGRAGAHLVDDPVHQQIRAALPSQAIFAYARDDAARAAISFVLSQQPDQATAILSAFAGALTNARPDSAIESSLLGGGVDAVGVTADYTFNVAGVLTETNASAVLHLAEPIGEVNAAPTDVSPLYEWIPRNAMVVLNGENGRNAAMDILTGVPLYNFAGAALNGFPVPVSPAAQSGQVALPAPEQIITARTGFLEAVRETGGVDLQTEVLDRLEGSYTVALIPRPNNPTPLLNTPYDVLIAANTRGGTVALRALADVLRGFLGDDALTESRIENLPFYTITAPNGATVLKLGVLNNVLLIGTGDALDAALAARDGQNALVGSPAWENMLVNGAPPPIYVDANAFYSTFLAQLINGAAGGVPINHVGASTTLTDDGLYRLDVRVTLVSP